VQRRTTGGNAERVLWYLRSVVLALGREPIPEIGDQRGFRDPLQFVRIFFKLRVERNARLEAECSVIASFPDDERALVIARVGFPVNLALGINKRIPGKSAAPANLVVHEAVFAIAEGAEG